MIYFHSTSDFFLAGPCAVTLGKFDGVHQGHRLLMNRICALEQEGCVSAAFAIEAGKGQQLMTAREQQQAMEQIGIQALIRCPFVPEFASMSPEAFIEEFLLRRMHARYVAVGCDYRFGHRREGDASFLRAYGNAHGFETFIIEKALYHGKAISSTWIREELRAGHMEDVNAMLGDAFPVCGIVQHGAHLGTRLGMPTINLIPDVTKLLPPNGVYYSLTEVEGTNGCVLPGITNVGFKPTVDGKQLGVETYLYEFAGDLYGREVCTRLLSFVRPERKFGSLKQLQDQIRADIETGKDYFCGQGIMDGQPVAGSDWAGASLRGSDSESDRPAKRNL